MLYPLIWWMLTQSVKTWCQLKSSVALCVNSQYSVCPSITDIQRKAIYINLFNTAPPHPHTNTNSLTHKRTCRITVGVTPHFKSPGVSALYLMEMDTHIHTLQRWPLKQCSCKGHAISHGNQIALEWHCFLLRDLMISVLPFNPAECYRPTHMHTHTWSFINHCAFLLSDTALSVGGTYFYSVKFQLTGHPATGKPPNLQLKSS